MRTLLLLLIASLAGGVHAQTNETVKLNLVSPLDYQVFQRQTPTSGKIVIECSLETTARGTLTNLDGLEARLTGESAGGTLPGDWQPLPFDNRVRHFRA